MNAEYHHVKGHQDKNGQELDFQARLNIRADYLVGEYIYNNIQPRPYVPVDAVVQCHVKIGSNTITSNYLQEIRDTASAPALRKHILTCCCKSATSSMIDWNLFSTSNQRMKHLRVCTTKLI